MMIEKSYNSAKHYDSKSLTAIAIANEVGHAIQDQQGENVWLLEQRWPPLLIRSPVGVLPLSIYRL